MVDTQVPGTPGDPGSGTDANDTDWDLTPNDGPAPSPEPTTDPLPTQTEPAPAAEPLKTETGEPQLDDQGQPIVKDEGGDLPPFHEHPRWQEMLASQADMKETITGLEGRLQNAAAQLEFYQEQMNAGTPPVTETPAGIPQPSAQYPTGQPQGQPQSDALPSLADLPEGIPTAPVLQPDGTEKGGWDNQREMASYIDHRSIQLAEHAMNQAYQSTIMPVFEKINKAIIGLQEATIKAAHPDFDEVVKGAWEDAFVTDPAGTIVGVKNQALVNYFNAQSNPQLAAYNYALNKMAPTKIKETAQKITTQTLQSVGKKPTGPTQPAGQTPVETKPQLDWETPPDEAEKILDSEGLIS